MITSIVGRDALDWNCELYDILDGCCGVLVAAGSDTCDSFKSSSTGSRSFSSKCDVKTE